MQCVELLQENVTVDFIDINSGCPIDLVYQKGMGAALLEHKTKLQDMLLGMSSVATVPITIKCRYIVFFIFCLKITFKNRER